MCNIMQIILIIRISSLNCVQIVANIDKIAISYSYLSTILLMKYCYFSTYTWHVFRLDKVHWLNQVLN